MAKEMCIFKYIYLLKTISELGKLAVLSLLPISFCDTSRTFHIASSIDSGYEQGETTVDRIA